MRTSEHPRFLIGFLPFLFAVFVAGPAVSSALVQESTDGPAIQSVIAEQLDAFKLGDDSRAYGQAAPSVRRIFPSTDVFMAMVRGGYAALIDPAGVLFTELQTKDGRGVQKVVVTDRSGGRWLAQYLMEQQADGSWRIAGCHLTPLSDESASLAQDRQLG